MAADAGIAFSNDLVDVSFDNVTLATNRNISKLR